MPVPVIGIFAGPGGLSEGFAFLKDHEQKPFFNVSLSDLPPIFRSPRDVINPPKWRVVKMRKIPKSIYTAEFKVQAIEHAKLNGRSATAKALNLRPQTLANWIN